MRQLLPLQLRLRGSLLLARDVYRDAEYSWRLVASGEAGAAAARGDPSLRAIGQDDAILRLIGAAGLQRVPDRRCPHGAIGGMHAFGQALVPKRFVRREAEELPSFIRHPDRVVRDV